MITLPSIFGSIRKRGLVLLPLCMMLLLQAGSAHAQCSKVNTLFDELVADDVGPISEHYVQKVIDRTEDALAYTNPTGTVTFGDISFLKWLSSVVTAFMSLSDTQLRIVEHGRDLQENTACLHIDLLIMELLMEKARCELEDSFEQKDVLSILQRQPLLSFLNQRYAHLVNGARDPEHVDTGWGKRYWFDPPKTIWCCPDYAWGTLDDPIECESMSEERCIGEQYDLDRDAQAFDTLDSCIYESNGCVPPSNYNPDMDGRMCPFHSNYLPPTVSGYGCDREALFPFKELEVPEYNDGRDPPIVVEYEAIRNLVKQRNLFIKEAGYLKEVAEKEAELAGTSPPDLSGFGAARRRRPGGVKPVRLGCNEENEQAGEDSKPPAQDQWPPKWPEGAIRWELRGPFAFAQRHEKILRAFADLRTQWEEIRQMPNYLKFPNEFPPGQERDDAYEREVQVTPLDRLFRQYARNLLAGWMRTQGEEESFIVTKASDALREIVEEFEPVRESTKKLAELASNLDDGVRGFTRNLAYFLRISCIFRPCNERLEQILKVSLEDSCFPYTSGQYLDDPLIHETCKEDADLEIDP